MRVLVVAYHFPPDPAVGGLRALKLARAFRAAGHEVVVLAAAISLPETIVEDGIAIHRVRSGAGLRELLVRLQRPGRHAIAAAASDDRDFSDRSDDGYAAPHHLPAWKRFVFSLMWLPDDRQGFILPAVRAGSAIALPHLIYTTAPPNSIHIVGRLLKRSLGVPWISEYRDPWTDNPSKPAHVRSRMSDAMERWLERWALRAADAVVAVTAANAASLSRKLSAGRGRSRDVLVFRNGIDRILDTPPPDRDGPIRILYLGDLYLHRDPLPFLRGLASLMRRNRLRPESVTVDFYGSCRYFHDVSIQATVEELGLSTIVSVHDRIPHHQVSTVLAEADVLLLLAQKQPAQVPNKLYEYLGARRPILAFLDRDGESATLLRQAGRHTLIVDDDPSGVENAIENAVRTARKGQLLETATIDHLSADRQFEALVTTAETIAR
jgi:hypothetical protein